MTRPASGRSHAPQSTRHRASTGVDRGEAILSAALELFAIYGYRATTMADIGSKVGIRGPSLYKHVESKQAMLAAIMTRTMRELLSAQAEAARSDGDVRDRLQRVTVAHVRYHAQHRYEAFVGNREIDNLEEPNRSTVLRLRREYESNVRELVREGQRLGVFSTASDRLASYAILDMGIGVSAWFNPLGTLSPDDVAGTYAVFVDQMLTAATGSRLSTSPWSDE